MFRSSDCIGPYTLTRALGRGSFGEVWLAERRSSFLAVQVALKLPIVAQTDIQAVKDEATIWLSASGHPNIVPVIDAESYDGHVAIASEYISGGSLAEWLDANGGRAPSTESAIEMANGILAGLDYLHRVGITHRDLKPDNILLQDGIPRLTDFGLARVLKADAGTGTVSGTPRYMAPETFRGAYSPASDLWSLGVILHRMLAGTPPFPSEDLMALILAIEQSEPEPLPASTPDRLRDIVLGLLSKHPEDRMGPASAVREALAICLRPMAEPATAPRDSSRQPSGNLPIQPTSFVGRRNEIAELNRLLKQSRLITLTGTGGCGKTRLALQTAAETRESFPDGVWVAELAALSDPALVAQTIVQALDLTERPGTPIMHLLTDELKVSQIMLVLDNCEHLLDECARVAETLLRNCPGVTILASSREALNIAGEQTFRVPSLSVPPAAASISAADLAAFESVQLFVERACLHRSGFSISEDEAAALASVCRRLDGIPLAIELAAAKVRTLSVRQIAERLDDRFRLLTGGNRTALPRQQTLRAMIDWSYSLLTEQERALLCRAASFAGGWTLEAVETVCAGDPIEQWEILDLLTGLVDKSMVQMELSSRTARYSLLETVRQYAVERLLERGESEFVRDRHLAYYAGLAEPRIDGPSGETAAWLDTIGQEHDNIRYALEWSDSADPARVAAGMRLLASVYQFWIVRHRFEEGCEWIERLLRKPACGDPAVRLRVLYGAGWLRSWIVDYRGARNWFEQSLSLAREVGDRSAEARALVGIGVMAHQLCDLEDSRDFLEQALRIWRELRDAAGLGFALGQMSWLLTDLGDFDGAHAIEEEAVSLTRLHGSDWQLALKLIPQGDYALYVGDVPLARSQFEEAMAISRRLEDRRGVASAAAGLGRCCRAERDAARAIPHFQESLAIGRELGDATHVSAALCGLGLAAMDLGDSTSAHKYLTDGITVYGAEDHSWAGRGRASALEAFAYLALSLRHIGRAACLLGAAERLREQIRVAVPPGFRREYDEARATIASHSGDTDIAREWERGRTVSIQEAVRIATEMG